MKKTEMVPKIDDVAPEDPDQKRYEIKEEDLEVINEGIRFLEEYLNESQNPNTTSQFLNIDDLPFSEAMKIFIQNLKNGYFLRQIRPEWGSHSVFSYLVSAKDKAKSFKESSMEKVDPLDPDFLNSEAFVMAREYALKEKRLKPVIDAIRKSMGYGPEPEEED